MITWARVSFSWQADAMLRQMDGFYRQRVNNIIQVIKVTHDDAKERPVGHLLDGTKLFQRTGGNLHISYAIKYWTTGCVLQIVFIEIRDWEPLDGINIGEQRGNR
ncbi:MAG: hypothetical protein HC828_01460 [Blastochloris sp.]|nr:hypothetical protein [Blastochloris sp.]